MGAADAGALGGGAVEGNGSTRGKDGEVILAGLTAGRVGDGVNRTVGDTGAAASEEDADSGFTEGAASERGRKDRSALRGSAACSDPPSGRGPAARRAVRRSRSKGSSGSDIFPANHELYFGFDAATGGAGCAFCGEITARTRGVSPAFPDTIRWILVFRLTSADSPLRVFCPCVMRTFFSKCATPAGTS